MRRAIRTSDVTTVVLYSPIFFFVLACGKNLPIVISIALLLGYLTSCFVDTRRLRAAVRILFITALVTMLSPLDVTVRRATGISVAVLPVAYDLGARQHIRDLLAKGKRENRDFVIVTRAPLYVPLRWALVVSLPV